MVKNMTGKKFGMLTIIEPAGALKNGEMFWRCRCDCGNETVTRGSLLRNGTTKSCGCYRKIAAQKFRKQNEYIVVGTTAYVSMPNSKQKMLCDVDDWDKLKNFRWHLSHGYATTNMPRSSGSTQKTKRFHSFLLNTDHGLMCDHINRNKLDNRKSNLRVVTATENVLNRDIYRNNTSGYRGVSFNKPKNKWAARLTYNKKVIALGYFSEIMDAVEARRAGEIKYFGKEIDA